MTWTCMVCGDERPDSAISVAYRPTPFPELQERAPDSRVNVRYCNDRPECAGTATTEGPWPLGGVERL